MVDLDLTKRQKEIFDFIGKYAAKTGYPPTVREIGKAVGLHSSSTVHAHLANLEKIGLLRRDPSKPRAIELLFDKAKRTVMPGGGLPLVGQRRRRRADPGRREHRGVHRSPRRDRWRGRRLHPPDPRRKHEERRHPRIRLRRRPSRRRSDRRRNRRRPDRRGGDREALLPRKGPHPAAARERRNGADPQHRGPRHRQGRRGLQEGLRRRPWASGRTRSASCSAAGVGARPTSPAGSGAGRGGGRGRRCAASGRASGG